MSTVVEQVYSEAVPASSHSACPTCGSPATQQFLQAPDRFHGRQRIYQLVRCTNCRLVRLADPPRPDELAFHYGDGYHKLIVSAGEQELTRRWRRQRDTVLNLQPGGDILDIGCSSGAFLRTLRFSSWRLHGVEISEVEAAQARESSGAEVFVGDPLDAPYPPESFDVVTCFHLLEHVYQPLGLLRRVETWLKPGGFLYVIVPNINSWEARLLRSYWYGLELPRHLIHFSPQSLERVASSASLKTAKLTTIFDDSFVEHSLHYVFETLMSRFGRSMEPLSAGVPASLPLKVVRKLFRMSFVFSLRLAAAIAGRGASIEAIFVKRV